MYGYNFCSSPLIYKFCNNCCSFLSKFSLSNIFMMTVIIFQQKLKTDLIVTGDQNVGHREINLTMPGK